MSSLLTVVVRSQRFNIDDGSILPKFNPSFSKIFFHYRHNDALTAAKSATIGIDK